MGAGTPNKNLRPPIAEAAEAPNNTIPQCTRCGGLHYGTYKCPYLDEAVCVGCGGSIEPEKGSDFSIHPNRKFSNLGEPYHPECTIVPTPQENVEPTTPCPSCVAKDAEIARLRSLEENNRALLEVVKQQEGELVALKKVAEKAEEYERLETERVTGIRASDGDIVSLTREAKERLFEAVRERRSK